jgi:hypothetical protein
MPAAHSPYTEAGRDALAGVIAYERRRFGAVRATVADRILTALADTYARPSLADPMLAGRFDQIAHHIFNGDPAAVALHAVDLVAAARDARHKLDGES